MSGRDSNPQREPQYKRLPLVDLIAQIATKSDAHALEEFHSHRTVFRGAQGQPQLFVEFVDRLRESRVAWEWCGHKVLVLDQARDLTISKFSNLPRAQDASDAGTRNRRPQLKQTGPDCRYYFQAFLDHVACRRHPETPVGAIEEERMAAVALQGLVNRHFRLSCLECARRADRLVRRYPWQVNGRTVQLWFPVEMTGQACREWLHANLDDPDLSRPGERERIQSRIDVAVHRRRLLLMSDVRYDLRDVPSTDRDLPWSVVRGVAVGDLAEAVAVEKSDHIAHQRPAIRALGAETLKQMIRRVFCAIAAGSYNDGSVAAEFGLRKATFSRFAGSRWDRASAGAPGANVPDLWRNTAQTLAGHPAFVAAAREAGVWRRVTSLLDEATGRAKRE